MFVWLLCILINYSLYVWVHGGLRTSLDMLVLWRKKWKPSSLWEWNLEFLTCGTTIVSSTTRKTTRHQNHLYSKVMLNTLVTHPGSACGSMTVLSWYYRCVLTCMANKPELTFVSWKTLQFYGDGTSLFIKNSTFCPITPCMGDGQIYLVHNCRQFIGNLVT